jgi:hypothetical protein
LGTQYAAIVRTGSCFLVWCGQSRFHRQWSCVKKLTASFVMKLQKGHCSRHDFLFVVVDQHCWHESGANVLVMEVVPNNIVQRFLLRRCYVTISWKILVMEVLCNNIVQTFLLWRCYLSISWKILVMEVLRNNIVKNSCYGGAT